MAKQRMLQWAGKNSGDFLHSNLDSIFEYINVVCTWPSISISKRVKEAYRIVSGSLSAHKNEAHG
jgi:hypothetical protein